MLFEPKEATEESTNGLLLQVDLIEGVVIDIHAALVKVGGVQITVAVYKSAGKAGVAGAVRRLDYNDSVR